VKNIVYQVSDIIKKKTNEDPFSHFEKATRNASPVVEASSTCRWPNPTRYLLEVSGFRATNSILRWLLFNIPNELEV
jgi:ribosomal protein S7